MRLNWMVVVLLLLLLLLLIIHITEEGQFSNEIKIILIEQMLKWTIEFGCWRG